MKLSFSEALELLYEEQSVERSEVQSRALARDGCSYNYATTPAGEILSDVGVDIRERRGMLDRSKPFAGYLSSDGKHFTGWKGNILGTVTRSTLVRLTRWSFTHGKYIRAVQVRDVHGGMWHGRGSEGVCITLRPLKR